MAIFMPHSSEFRLAQWVNSRVTSRSARAHAWKNLRVAHAHPRSIFFMKKTSPYY